MPSPASWGTRSISPDCARRSWPTPTRSTPTVWSLAAAPAALAVASTSGAVDEGDVGHDLVRADPRAPFGLRVDDATFLQAFDQASSRADVIVVDPGETDRANAYSATMASTAARTSMQDALRRTDVLLGKLRGRLSPDTLLIVAGMTPPTSKAELVPVVFWGAGTVPGHLVSPSTNRPDLVTLTDLAPTVLASLGAAVPSQMVGQPLRFRPGTVDWKALQGQNDLVKARDRVYPGFLNAFIDIQIVLYLIAAIALLRQDTPSSVKRFLTWAFLTVAAVPVMTFVVRAVPPLSTLGVGTNLLVWLGAGLLVALLLDIRWRTPLDPLVVVSALGVALLSLDLAFGAHLQVASLLGYTPTVAARFVGIGNAAYAVLAAGAVIVACGLVDRSDRPRRRLVGRGDDLGDRGRRRWRTLAGFRRRRDPQPDPRPRHRALPARWAAPELEGHLDRGGGDTCRTRARHRLRGPAGTPAS